MSAAVEGSNELAFGVARELIEIDFHDSAGSSYSVSPDGRRVLVNKPVDVSLREVRPISLVTGWDREIHRVVGRE